MANEMVVWEKVTRGPESSFKVISKYKGDLKTLTKFVSGIIGKVIYLARRSLIMDIEMLAVVGDLTKNFDQVCVWYHWKGYLSGLWESDNGH